MAVTRQSSWRSEPAAALRGLAKGSSPCRASSAGSWPRSAPSGAAPRRAPRAAAGACPRRAGGARRGWRRAPPMVRRLAVTSSPFAPSPRVEPVRERAVLVDQLHRQPVELRLARRSSTGGLGAAGRAAGGPARRTRRSSSSLVTLPSESMGSRCATLANCSLGAPATRWVGESGVASARVRRLQRLELPHEPVVLGVGEDRLVEDVVGVVGGADLGPQCSSDPSAAGVGMARRWRRGARRRRQPARARSEDGVGPRCDSGRQSAAGTNALPYDAVRHGSSCRGRVAVDVAVPDDDELHVATPSSSTVNW